MTLELTNYLTWRFDTAGAAEGPAGGGACGEGTPGTGQAGARE